MAKILLTGVSGVTGKAGVNVLRYLDQLVSPDDDVFILQHIHPVDLILTGCRDRTFVIQSLPNSKEYDVAIHFAANIHTSKGRNPEEYKNFKRDNIDLTRRVCASGFYVLQASTDYVFSGNGLGSYKESDIPDQLNYYGSTKAIAEEIVQSNAGASVRFASPVGIRDNLIINKVFDRLEGRQAWPFWNDQFVGISLFDDIMKVFKSLYDSGKPGIYHVACNGILSRADLANKVLEVYRLNGIQRVNDCIEEEPCNVPYFPRKLGLETSQTRNKLGISSFSSIDDAVRLHVLSAKKPDAL